ncbi:RIP metalloprotease RseP [Chitinilyticum litopenaei]|uniref:RIP metalloprotease RseP n=1 Tax=Chitinilyticum litopenaei TaxID=1121276 RepID=UPI0004164584|nr:RIP metalloprotease RseP [Chitinilyticum litopenaei]
MLTVVAFVLMIAILVTIHEYGHYWVARRCGVTVLKFSIGFGKPLLQWRRGETVWQIAMIPLGGFVQMQGEDEGELLGTRSEGSFSGKPAWQKMLIVLAGPLANFLLAWLLFTGLFAYGLPAIRPVIGAVVPDSVSAQAGVRAGDQVLAIGDRPVASWEELRMHLLMQAGAAQALVHLQRPTGERYMLALPLDKGGFSAYDPALVQKIGLEVSGWDGLVAAVTPASPAQQAGLQEGDRVLALEGRPVESWRYFQQVIQGSPGKAVSLQVFKRDGETVTLVVTPERAVAKGVEYGRIGLSPRISEAELAKRQFTNSQPLLAAAGSAARYTWELTILSVRMIGHLFTGLADLQQISGPIGVAEYAGHSASLGLLTYLQFVAFISLSLAVLNLLPVPVLDGGHFLYHTAELIRGRPLPTWLMEWGQRLGVLMLIGLMVLAFYNDLSRLITG